MKNIFTWDWAAAVPALLHAGDTLYLVGLDTLGRYADEAWHYYLPDALGSVRQEIDANGNVSSIQDWTPFGVAVSGEQSGLGYTGEWWDTAVGLQYLRARWYEPAVGRFTHVDPWPGTIEVPASQQPYVYGLNNPVLYTDPNGESVILTLVGGALVGGVIGGVAGGASYALSHPGQPVTDYFSEAEFQHAVLVGMASGTVSSLVGGGALIGLGQLGIQAVSLSSAAGIGALVGASSSGAGRVTVNLLTPCVPWHQGMGQAMLVGGVLGGVLGGTSYGVKTLYAQYTYKQQETYKEAVRQAALTKANATRGYTRRNPGAAGALRTRNGSIFSATSGGNPETLHPDVQAAVSNARKTLIERGETVPGFIGRCAEPRLISDALYAGIDVQGGMITTVKVRPVGRPGHSLVLEPCDVCVIILKEFNITWVH